MRNSNWRTFFTPSSERSRRSRAPLARPRRPRLELLEDRLAPATLDVTGGALTYVAGTGINNNLTVSLNAGTYTFHDTGETITLTGNAMTAGFNGSGTNTVTGPSSAVTASINITLGNGTDTLNLGPFDAIVPTLSATDGSHAGDTATVAAGGNGVIASGPVSLVNFDAINVNNAIGVTNGSSTGVTLRALTSITTTGTITSDTSVALLVGNGGTIDVGANLTGTSSVRVGDFTQGDLTTTNITSSITVSGGTTGVAFAFSDVSVGSNVLTVMGDNIGFASSSSSTSLTSTGGILILEPFTPSRNIIFSDNTQQTPPPDLSIPTNELNGITGFASIVVGSAITTGNLQVLNPVTIASSLSLDEGGVGGTITVNGKITMTGSTSALTFLTLGGNNTGTTLNADLATNGSFLNFLSNVTLGTAATVTLDTTNAGAVATGGLIDFADNVNDDGSPTTLVLAAGTAGDVTFSGAVGNTTAPAGLTVNSARDLTFSSTIHTTGALAETAGTGTTTLNGTSGTGIGGALTLHANIITLNTATVTTVGPVTLTASGALNLNAGLNAGAGNVGLSGDPITLGATVTTTGTVTVTDTGLTGGNETGTGAIAAGTLVLADGGSSGGFQLAGSNAISTLNGAVHSFVSLFDTLSLTVGGGAGLNTNGTNLVLVSSGLLTLGDGSGTTENVTAAGAEMDLSGGSGISEASNTLLTAKKLSLQGGLVSLPQANLVNVLAASVTGSLAFTNARQLIVGTVNTLNGINTHGNNLALTVSGGLLALGDATATQENVTAATVDINTTGLFENGNSIIVAGNLRLQGGTGFMVNQANQVGTLAVNVTQQLAFTNSQALTVGSVLGTNGLNGNGANLALAVAGLLTLGDGSGTAENVGAAGAGFFVTAGGITQASNSIVTAFGLVLTGTGSFTLNRTNGVALLAANVTGALNFTDSQPLIVGAITSTVGLNTHGGNLTLTDSGGLLALGDGGGSTEDLTAAGATVSLNAAGIFENGNSVIVAQGLLLQGSVGFEVNQANQVGTLAGSVSAPLNFSNAQALTIGQVGGINGLNTNGANVALSTTGLLTLGDGSGTAENLTAAGAGVFLNTAGLAEASNAAVSAFTMSLGGTGTFSLPGANSLSTLAASVTGALAYNNVGSLVTLGLSTGTGNSLALASGGLLALGDGSGTAEPVSAPGAIVDMLAAGIFQSSNGAITAGSLRLQGGSTMFGLALTGPNAVGTLAASIVNSLTFKDTQALTVGSLQGTTGVVTASGSVTFIADSMSFGAAVQGTGTLFLQTLTASRNVLIAPATPDPNSLDLLQSDVSNIVGHNGGQNPNGFAMVDIGLSSDTGNITVANPVTFSTSVTLLTMGTISGTSNITVPNGDTHTP